ncbi:DUF5712 family protein [Limibacter armeniacum]|uniref:DUF5712 family protein n=1 Tax=Limibacter armeniacum TaxID=466084 RepID=UPI002FE67E0A
MVVDITDSPKGGNTGSSATAVQYLSKENEGKEPKDMEFFFSQNENHVINEEVVGQLDASRRGIKSKEAKFFNLTIAPSQKELKHIGNDREKLMEYARGVMEIYADNFGKGLKSEDIVWYAKIEKERTYKGTEKEVREGKVKRGEKKAGDQTHIHVLIRRKGADKKTLLSPLTNHKNTVKGKIKGGFDRTAFKIKCEKHFDKEYSYKREITETFEYVNAIKNGTEEDRMYWLNLERKLDKEKKKSIDKIKQAANLTLNKGQKLNKEDQVFDKSEKGKYNLEEPIENKKWKGPSLSL